ncbi:hypothetical protein AB833_03940 [Chromatiales bacterium (ex Bugula neritina AB1)]|nr:hypothetical protein AB833_03940 [Chromatiales bacterium (ex Bugula neritina AB1)]
MSRKDRPHTSDGRYLVSRGVLKRCTNPSLGDSERRKAVKALMQARMAKERAAVVAAKVALGEAGPVWWDDSAPDYSGQVPGATPYAAWWSSLTDDERSAGD